MKPQRLWKVNKPKLPVRTRRTWQFFSIYAKAQDWKTIAWCFSLALVFWLFNALGQEHTTTLYFSPSPLLPKSDTPAVCISPNIKQIGVNVSAVGWKLLPFTLRWSLEKIPIKIEKIGTKQTIYQQQIIQYLNENIADLKVNYVLEDSFAFDYQYYLSKELTVQLPSPTVWLAPNAAIINAPSITPLTINVEGPEPFLKQISDSIDIQVPLQNISQNFEANMSLKLPEVPYLKFSQREVRVSFEVIKVKKQELVFDVVWKNLPKDVLAEVEPSFGLIKVVYPETEIFDAESYKQVELDFLELNRYNMSVKPLVIAPQNVLVFKVLPKFFKVKLTDKPQKKK
jgi:hypothetical protein